MRTPWWRPGAFKAAAKRIVLRFLLDLAHKNLEGVPMDVVRDAFRQAPNRGVIVQTLPKLRTILGDQLTPADDALLNLIDLAIPPEARPN